MREYRRPVLAILLGIVFVLSATAATSRAVHEWLHYDAQAHNHVCVVSFFSHQQILAGDAAVACPAPPLMEIASSDHSLVAIYCAVDVKLSPSRAPPAFQVLDRVVG